MTPAIASALLPLGRRIDPERAHRLGLLALSAGLAGAAARPPDPALAVRAMGLDFPSPIGLAAGFDKDAVAVGGLARLGFGLVEVGTVTPRPQAGNPRPRLFRLPTERAVINRMGFNNQGIAACLRRLARLSTARPCRIGVNLGINREGAEPERDYPRLVAAAAPLADYLVINVSSPNTPGLRDLQAADRLRRILVAVAETVPRRPPLLVKLSPDLSAGELEAIVAVAVATGIDGLIIGNTTLARPAGLRAAASGEAGGLSGAPLFARSTARLARAFPLAAGRLSLIGAGGVATGEQALAKILAGASLVQLYTAFAYAGPALIPRLHAELLTALRRRGFAGVTQAIGAGHEQVACSA